MTLCFREGTLVRCAPALGQGLRRSARGRPGLVVRRPCWSGPSGQLQLEGSRRAHLMSDMYDPPLGQTVPCRRRSDGSLLHPRARPRRTSGRVGAVRATCLIGHGGMTNRHDERSPRHHARTGRAGTEWGDRRPRRSGDHHGGLYAPALGVRRRHCDPAHRAIAPRIPRWLARRSSSRDGLLDPRMPSRSPTA